MSRRRKNLRQSTDDCRSRAWRISAWFSLRPLSNHIRPTPTRQRPSRVCSISGFIFFLLFAKDDEDSAGEGSGRPSPLVLFRLAARRFISTLRIRDQFVSEASESG